VDECRRHVFGRRGDDDGVELALLGPAQEAVADPGLDVAVTEAGQALAARASFSTFSTLFTSAASSASTAAW
jgi:hypothetical protein